MLPFPTQADPNESRNHQTGRLANAWKRNQLCWGYNQMKHIAECFFFFSFWSCNRCFGFFVTDSGVPCLCLHHTWDRFFYLIWTFWRNKPFLAQVSVAILRPNFFLGLLCKIGSGWVNLTLFPVSKIANRFRRNCFSIWFALFDLITAERQSARTNAIRKWKQQHAMRVDTEGLSSFFSFFFFVISKAVELWINLDRTLSPRKGPQK